VRRHAPRALLAAALLALGVAGCGRAVGPASAGVLPAGCGPRPAAPPAAAALPAAPLSSAPLPIEGPWVAAFAGGPGAIYASVGPGFALAHSLYVTTDDGQAWRALPEPAGLGNQLEPLAATPAGLLVGADGQNLRVRTPGGAWSSTPLWNVLALAADADGRLETLAYDTAPPNHAVLYEGTASAPTQQHWDLGVPVPAGAAIALVGEAAVVALGGPGGGVTLDRAEPKDAPAPFTPVPAGAAGPVRDLVAAPDGTLYLLAGSGLYALAPGAAAWRALPEPVPPAQTWHLALAGGDLYLTSGGEGGADSLWRAPAGGAWSALPVPPGYLGQLWTAAAEVWVGTGAGPAVVGPAGSPLLRTGGLAAPVSVVASAARRPTTAAAGWSGALFTTLDGGRHWRLATPPDPPPGDITTLAWSPEGSCLLVAYQGVEPPGTPSVDVSGDAGATWTRWPGLPSGPQTAPLQWPAGSGVWWLVRQGEQGGLERFQPGPAGWRAVALPAGIGAPEQVAAGPGGLWLADAQGHLWLVTFPRRTLLQRLRGRPASPPRARAQPGADGQAAWVVSDPYDPAVVYAGTRRSTDGGRHWTSVPLPFGQTLAPGSLAFGPDSPGVAAPSGAGLARDAGQAWRAVWSPASPGAGEVATAAAPAGPGRFYVAVQRLGLVVVPDASPAWQAAPAFSAGRWTALPGPAAASDSVEAAAPSDPALVYEVDLHGDVLASADGGQTLAKVGQAVVDGQGCCVPPGWAAGPHVAPSALAVSPADPKLLYLGLALQGATSAPPPQGLWVSRDGGQTWQATGLPAAAAVLGAAVAPDGTVYAVAAEQGYADDGGRLYRSPDDGVTWTALSSPAAPVFSVAVPRAREVLAGGPGLVWRSTDGGGSFAVLPLGLAGWVPARPALAAAAVVAVAETSGGAILAGGSPGLAVRSPDGTWHVAADAIGNPAPLPGGLLSGPGGTVLLRSAGATDRLEPAPG